MELKLEQLLLFEVKVHDDLRFIGRVHIVSDPLSVAEEYPVSTTELV